MVLGKIKVTAPAMITALMPREAVEDSKAKVGDKAEAVVKAAEVMISK
jgi:molybdopterin-binding protein